MSQNAAVEGKVWSSTVGSGVGLTAANLILWILGVTFWGAPRDAVSATAAVARVPDPIVQAIAFTITVGLTFVGGFIAKHTPRPEVTKALDEIEDEEDEGEDIELGSEDQQAPDVDDQDPEVVGVQSPPFV